MAEITLIIPVYKVEDYINRCVESVIAQTYKDFDVVLVDDGSPDNCGSICDLYAEKYYEKVSVIHKENEGLISARRIAIDNAKGEFCIFVDSDDFIEKDLLELVDKEFSSDNNIDLVMYSFSYFKNGEKSQRNRISQAQGG